MPQSITFLGAARTVTGSRHLLTLGKHKVLVDCGLFQGPREIRDRNWQPFAVPVDEIDAIVLTHAHMDHIGYLPRLVKQGYKGPVYATPATIALAKVSLPDSGRIQEEDARFHNKHQIGAHNPALPLYTEADTYETLKLLKPIHYYQWQELPGKATFRYLPAGHILGSAFAEIYFENGERIVMSGDLGRYNRPILKDPTPVEHGEFLVMESTYGDRLHGTRDPMAVLEEILTRAVRQESAVLVPSFAIGRTQELLWYIHQLEHSGRLPRIPIYVDSPMASATTLLYIQHEEDHDKDMKLDLSEGHSPFSPDAVKFIRDKNASQALNTMTGPMVIISGSGMLSGGRIIHHLRHRLDDPSTILIFTGYQADGTMGRRILDGAEKVSVFGTEVNVRAQIEELDMLSAHADADEIMRWAGGFMSAPRKTFLVHGEYEVQERLRDRIQKELGWDVEIPSHGQSFELN